MRQNTAMCESKWNQVHNTSVEEEKMLMMLIDTNITFCRAVAVIAIYAPIYLMCVDTFLSPYHTPSVDQLR